MSTVRVPARHRTWLSFAAWLVVGALYAVGFLGILSIGVLVLPVAIVCSVLLASRPSMARGSPALIGGLALPPFYVAYLNRAGPGMVCRQISGGQSCTQEWSPWPWLAAGLLLIALSIVVLSLRNRAEEWRRHNPA